MSVTSRPEPDREPNSRRDPEAGAAAASQPAAHRRRGPGRRSLLTAGIGAVAAVTAGVTLPAGRAGAASTRAGGSKIRNLTGPDETGRFAAPWTDLGIPARCPDGSLFFACGDTFSGSGVGAEDWRCPVGLRASNPDLASVTIDGAVGGDHAEQLVEEGHENQTTAIPSDVFTVGDTMYMHLMRGVLHQTHHSDFWRSTDNGETWEYLCQWPGDQYGGQFQQKTYAVADDGFCYVLSTVFNRDVDSDLLLHRVPQDALGDPNAYEPWGYANGDWAWGNAPTSISPRRRWGEICFRAMAGRYALTWLNMDPLDIRAQIFDTPTSDLFVTPEQTMIVPTDPGNDHDNAVAHPYGGFIFPGSTVADFHIAVSQWYDDQNYRVMQYRIDGLTA